MTDPPGWSDILGLGAVVAVLLLVGLGLGALVDSFTDTAPAFLLVGLLLGIVAAVGYAVARFRTYLKPDRSPDAHHIDTPPTD